MAFAAQGCVIAIALCAVTVVASTVADGFWYHQPGDAYLLGVVIVATLYGRWRQLLATLRLTWSFDLFLSRRAAPLAVSMCSGDAGVMFTRWAVSAISPPAYATRRGWPYREQRAGIWHEMSKALAVGEPTGYGRHQRALYCLDYVSRRAARFYCPVRNQLSGLTPAQEAITVMTPLPTRL